MDTADTPPPPYYACIFTSQRTSEDDEGYAAMAEEMVRLAREQPGFLGVESVRGTDGFGITVSYWDSEESIRRWREHSRHRKAQKHGKDTWYETLHIRIARVERESVFAAGETAP